MSVVAIDVSSMLFLLFSDTAIVVVGNVSSGVVVWCWCWCMSHSLYCTISIDSAITGHRGSGFGQNPSTVTGHTESGQPQKKMT